MRAQRRRDTKAELLIRSELWRRGLRYRVDLRPLPGMRRRADIVFTRARVAVLVDGCFWHRCPEHSTIPKANREWWIDKLDANVARDRVTDARLGAAGWLVIRVWEHEDPVRVVDRIEQAVRSR